MWKQHTNCLRHGSYWWHFTHSTGLCLHRGEICSMPSPLPIDTQRETPAACSTIWLMPSNTSTASTLCTETSNQKTCWWVHAQRVCVCVHAARSHSLLQYSSPLHRFLFFPPFSMNSELITLTLGSRWAERWLIPAALTPPAHSVSSLSFFVPSFTPPPFCRPPWHLFPFL